MYKELNVGKITLAIQQLEARIADRFPTSNLRKVCSELSQISLQAEKMIALLQKPNFFLKSLFVIVVLFSLFVISITFYEIPKGELFNNLQNIISTSEAFLNELVMIIAALYFVFKLETIYKQKEILKYLHEVRTIIHVIDMHQLTKDPSSMLLRNTPNSPEREINSYDLTRYLNYCSEMLSLSSKVAASYAVDSKDQLVLDTIHNIEVLSSSISGKIWQKININQIILES